MKTAIRQAIGNQWVILSLRLLLGVVFIAAGVSKLSSHAEFINTVMGYGILPDSLAQLYGSILPWAELSIGLCLILGIFSTLAAVLVIPITLSFIIANAYALFHHLSDTCGCFGHLIPMSYSASLAIDVLMLLMAMLLVGYREKAAFLSIGALISRPELGLVNTGSAIFEKGSKLVLVALVTLAIGVPLHGGTPQSSIYSQIDSSLQQEKPVFLFFYLEGCRPCEAQEPIINELGEDYKDQVVFIHINYKEEPQVVMDFSVRTTPTTFLIIGMNSEGEYVVYQRFNQFTNEEALRNSIDLALELSST